jgi:Flp pilus assembly protein protease CpaA
MAVGPLLLATSGRIGMAQIGATGWPAEPSAAILLSALIVAAYTDLRWRKIPNWVTYPLALWALAIGAAVSLGWVSTTGGSVSVGFGESLVGAAVAFVVMYLVYQVAGGGAGDVKLATVIGACLGAERAIESLIAAYILAAVGILLWLTWTVGPRTLLLAFARKLGRFLSPAFVGPICESERRVLERPVALGPFFGLGTAIALLGARGHFSW